MGHTLRRDNSHNGLSAQGGVSGQTAEREGRAREKEKDRKRERSSCKQGERILEVCMSLGTVSFSCVCSSLLFHTFTGSDTGRWPWHTVRMCCLKERIVARVEQPDGEKTRGKEE